LVFAAHGNNGKFTLKMKEALEQRGSSQRFQAG
jgi:hypothetical protein